MSFAVALSMVEQAAKPLSRPVRVSLLLVLNVVGVIEMCLH